jgi:hypothetical protein
MSITQGVCIVIVNCREEKKDNLDILIKVLKVDEKYYIKDKKNKIKAKNGVIIYWPAEEFVSDINLKKSTILVVTKIMKKDVKFVRFLLDGTAYLVLAAATSYVIIREIPKVKLKSTSND